MDPTTTIDQNQIPENADHINVSNEFFGGNVDVFKNLDKFEQLTNPLGSSTNEALAELGSFDSFEEDFSDDGNLDTISNPTVEVDTFSENEVQRVDDQTLGSLNDMDSGFDLHDPFLQAVATEEENTKDPLADATDFLMTDLEEINAEGLEEEQVTNSYEPLEEFGALEIEDEVDEEDLEEIEDNEDGEDLGVYEKEVDEEDLEEIEDGVDEEDLEEIEDRIDEEDENLGIYNKEIEEEIYKEELEEDIDEEDEENIENEDEEDPEEEASKIMETYDPTTLSLQSKFEQLLKLGTKILNLDQKFHNIEHQDFFEILGEDSKNAKIIYKIFLDDQDTKKVTILREFWDKKAEEEIQNSLMFLSNNEDHFSVMVDDYLLYQEDELADHEREEREVATKIDKFIFLFEQKERELNQKIEQQQVEKEKQKAFRAIFRNF